MDVSWPVEDIVAEVLRGLAPEVPENRPAMVARDSTERPANPPVKPSGPHSYPSTAAESSLCEIHKIRRSAGYRGLCTDRRLHDRRSRRAQRLDRLVVLATLRRQCLVRGASRHLRTRTMANLPADPMPGISRAYHDGTLVLETLFDTADGSVALIHFMPIGRAGSSIIRLVKGLRGKVAMQLHLALRFDYGVTVPWVTQLDDGSGLSAVAGPNQVVLRSPVPMKGRNFATVAEFDVAEGQCVPFVLTHAPSHLPKPPAMDWSAALEETELFWRGHKGGIGVRQIGNGRSNLVGRPKH